MPGTERLPSKMKSQRLNFSVAAGIAVLSMPISLYAQVDTVPVLLQQRILGRKAVTPSELQQLEFVSPNWVFATDRTGIGGSLFVSNDSGLSFHNNDGDTGYDYAIPHSKTVLYRATELPSGVPILQYSFDQGETWEIPPEWDSVRVFGLMSLSPDGKRIAIDESGDYNASLDYLAAISSSNYGSHWDYQWWSDTNLHYRGATHSIIRWADDHDGLILTPQADKGDTADMFVTSDGGDTWREIISARDSMQPYLWENSNFDVAYPFPSTIVLENLGGDAISFDTGQTWKWLPLGSPAANEQIDFVAPNRWIAGASLAFRDNQMWRFPNQGPYPLPVISTDSGETWQKVTYTGPHPIVLTSFKDSLNGIGSDGFEIVARTTDGGFSWQTVDSSDDMLGTIIPAVGRDSSYYAFVPFLDTNQLPEGAYAFFTPDRGVTWKQVLTNAVGYAFAGLDSDYWIGGTGFVTLKQLYGGKSITLFLTDRDSTRITPIDDHFVWVSNGNELYAVSYNGLNVSWLHAAVADNIPGYDSSNSYTFFPITRSVAYARTPDTLYVTTDGGSTWSLAASMPDRALDPEHWFQFTADTSQLRYTVDGGRSFRMIVVPGNAHALFPIDSQLWYANGFYTTDAGSSWNRIPGWNDKLGLYPVDRTTAFGQPFANNLSAVQVLWRLDLPSSSSGSQGIVESPKAVSSDCSVYPNPTTGVVTIRVPASVGMTAGAVTVTNLLGETVLTANPNASTPQPPPTPLRSAGGGVTLDLSGLPAGTYFVRFPSSKDGQPTVVVRKILKE